MLVICFSEIHDAKVIYMYAVYLHNKNNLS